MEREVRSLQALRLTLWVSLAVLASACGKKEPATAAAPEAPAVAVPAPSPEALAAEAEAASKTLAPTEDAWAPEAMEELLAPVALYPDVVLGQVLVASTNPQEVLDAGNWLLQNQSLAGDPLDEAAKKIGFTPPVRGLLQAPEVVDMMCSEMGWTTELGQAFVNDQQGVLDAVQRLRGQAQDAGNLQSSEQMKVATEVQEGQQVITVSPPSPEVVYVPQYDPVAAYAPAPAAVATTTTESTGHSTGAMVATGLLSFGAGLVVANIFDDDDDNYHHGYYSPNYYGRPMPYYPPYPYRPNYGNGYYPNHGYNRPPGYNHGYNNNNTVIINNDNDNYFNRYDNKSVKNRGSNNARSPITAAKPNRPELGSLNTKAKDGPKRAAPSQADAWKGQNSYAGNKGGTAKTASRNLPKVQGGYAGAKPGAKPGANLQRPDAKPAAQLNRPDGKPTGQYNRPDSKPASKPAAKLERPDAKPKSKPAIANKPAISSSGGGKNADRGRPTSSAQQLQRPDSRPASMPSGGGNKSKPSAMSGANRGGGGGGDRAASQRGKKSMPGGVPAKAKGGGGKKGQR